MMNVSDAFKQAVDSLERSVVAKLEIYFDGENNPPTTFDGDMIIDFKILEEASADSQNPLGVVSSNELTISLHNKNGAFTISNINSPYYKKIQKNILVKPYIGVILSDDSVEYIQMGKYWADDWKSPSDSLETSVTAYDLLYDLGDKDVPDIPLLVNVDIKYVFVVLFTALGLTAEDYIIDTNIVCKLQYVWFRGTVKNMLQALNTAGNCTASINRQGKIYVKSNNTNKAIAAILKDSNQLITAQNIQTYNSTVSKVNLNYVLIDFSEETELLSIEKYPVMPGVNSIANVSFGNDPVAKVTKISLQNSKFSSIDNIKYGVRTISFDINSTESENVDISVTGTYIIKNSSLMQVQKDELIDAIGEVKLDVSSDILQNSNNAKNTANSILDIVSMKDSKYTVTTRGNPALELMDNVVIDDVSDRIYMTPITIMRQEITWDGTLSINIEGRSLVGTNVYFNLSRKISSAININKDSKRVIGTKENITSDIKRAIENSTINSVDVSRSVNNSENINTDTERKTGIYKVANLDTQRRTLNSSTLNIDSIRKIGITENVSFNTKVEIVKSISSLYDTKRNIINSLIAYFDIDTERHLSNIENISTNTVRKLKISIYININAKRQLSNNQNIDILTKRSISTTNAVNSETNRLITVSDNGAEYFISPGLNIEEE